MALTPGMWSSAGKPGQQQEVKDLNPRTLEAAGEGKDGEEENDQNIHRHQRIKQVPRASGLPAFLPDFFYFYFYFLNTREAVNSNRFPSSAHWKYCIGVSPFSPKGKYCELLMLGHKNRSMHTLCILESFFISILRYF